MQGLLLVWRGCLFAGCTGWMCTADEATSFPRSRDRSTTEQAGFYQSINVCHGGYSSLFIVNYVSKSGECTADSAASLLAFFSPLSSSSSSSSFFTPLFSFIWLHFLFLSLTLSLFHIHALSLLLSISYTKSLHLILLPPAQPPPLLNNYRLALPTYSDRTGPDLSNFSLCQFAF